MTTTAKIDVIDDIRMLTLSRLPYDKNYIHLVIVIPAQSEMKMLLFELPISRFEKFLNSPNIQEIYFGKKDKCVCIGKVEKSDDLLSPAKLTFYTFGIGESIPSHTTVYLDIVKDAVKQLRSTDEPTNNSFTAR
ncbi:hypothetical protein A2V49_04780 [candidate division WWE3 bacterium RBG_19FT_COMBO_34_6]|uniref:Uncharacterized protein n=1 Tax=candidate division WWE3 bacterium RBG_19FT_COMBO_34_6 TaxID=1802612 RepID=A0A1F4UMU7_UNCKA|nr:MAG: hypothetical protein A2V49_04780 [candidate division WWE3 bacterium RBG_19FT_COMBO_34_6]